MDAGRFPDPAQRRAARWRARVWRSVERIQREQGVAPPDPDEVADPPPPRPRLRVVVDPPPDQPSPRRTSSAGC